MKKKTNRLLSILLCCGTVVADTSTYCPECDAQLKGRQPRFLRREVG